MDRDDDDKKETTRRYPEELDTLGLLDPNGQDNPAALEADLRFTQWKLRQALVNTDDAKLIESLSKALIRSHIPY